MGRTDRAQDQWSNGFLGLFGRVWESSTRLWIKKNSSTPFFPAKHPGSKNSRSTKSMDLAPNSTKSMECLKGYPPLPPITQLTGSILFFPCLPSPPSRNASPRPLLRPLTFRARGRRLVVLRRPAGPPGNSGDEPAAAPSASSQFFALS
jgi:hypothetical protein